MIGARLGNGLFLLAATAVLAACSMEIPSFMGREGDGQGVYNIRGEPVADPVPVPLTEVVVERALYGVLLRVEGSAPTQGYYSAALVPLRAGEPDAAGVVTFEFMAVPPSTAQAVGPARTRRLTAATFVPNLALKDMRAFRVTAAGTVHTLPAPAPIRPAAPPAAPAF